MSDLEEQIADVRRHLEMQQAISNAPVETRQVIFISSALAMLTRCTQHSNVPSFIPRLKDFFTSERSIESIKSHTKIDHWFFCKDFTTLEDKINETFMAALPSSKSCINSAMWSSRASRENNSFILLCYRPKPFHSRDLKSPYCLSYISYNLSYKNLVVQRKLQQFISTTVNN